MAKSSRCQWVKREIGSIRKKSEPALVGALVKYHHRRTERLTIKLRKLEQYKSCRGAVTKHTSHQKMQSPAVNKGDNEVNELAEELKAKISEVDVLLEQMRSQARVDKQSELYPCALSDSLEIRGKGKEKGRNNEAAKNH